MVGEVLPAVGAAQQDARERGHDAAPHLRQRRLWRRSVVGPGIGSFFPAPQVLQEGEGEPAQEHVVVQPAPGAAFEDRAWVG